MPLVILQYLYSLQIKGGSQKNISGKKREGNYCINTVPETNTKIFLGSKWKKCSSLDTKHMHNVPEGMCTFSVLL
jgi:hypothetical protein